MKRERDSFIKNKIKPYLEPRLFKRCELGPRPVPAPIRISVATETENGLVWGRRKFRTEKVRVRFVRFISWPTEPSENRFDGPLLTCKNVYKCSWVCKLDVLQHFMDDFLFQGIQPTAKSYNGPWLSCPSGHGMVDRALAFWVKGLGSKPA